MQLLDLLDYIYKRAYVTVLINGCLLNKNHTCKCLSIYITCSVKINKVISSRDCYKIRVLNESYDQGRAYANMMDV